MNQLKLTSWFSGTRLHVMAIDAHVMGYVDSGRAITSAKPAPPPRGAHR